MNTLEGLTIVGNHNTPHWIRACKCKRCPSGRTQPWDYGKHTRKARQDCFGVGGWCAGGIKKVLETSPPRTQQHLVTCSGRGLHNAALATCCCCVSVDTKLSRYSDLWQFRRQLLTMFVSVIKVYSCKSIQKIVVFSYPIKCCRS